MNCYTLRSFTLYFILLAMGGCQLDRLVDDKETRITLANEGKFFLEISMSDLEANKLAVPQTFGLPSYPTNLSDLNLLDYIDKKIKSHRMCKEGYVLKLGYWDHGSYTVVGKCGHN